MTLESFPKAENVEPKTKVEWDGKDFREEKCNPQAVDFLQQHPAVYEWLEVKSRKYINTAVCYLKQFCEWMEMPIEEWLSLNEKEARDKAWQYIRTFRIHHSAKARIFKGFAKMLYLYTNEKALPFIPSKHNITLEKTRIKYIMDKETCWKIINKAKNLRDETMLIFVYESGLRKNAVAHMTYGHYKNFIWFKITEDRKVISSNEHEGDIALFRVMNRKTKEFTHDDKLRGKIDWYYGCLHKEATKILKEYVAKYHEDSKEDTAFWYSSIQRWDSTKKKGLNEMTLYMILKGCVKRAGLPFDQITFHALRRGNRNVVRNTREISDYEFKEAITGHKLGSTQEAYFDKPVIEFAREYAYCDFSLPAPEKDQEIERLMKQVHKYEEAIEKAQATTKIEIEPLRPEATKEEIQKAFSQFNEPLEESTPQPSIIEPRLPSKPSESMSISKPQTEPTLTDRVMCPVTNQNVMYASCLSFCKLEEPQKYEKCEREGWKIV